MAVRGLPPGNRRFPAGRVGRAVSAPASSVQQPYAVDAGPPPAAGAIPASRLALTTTSVIVDVGALGCG
jgi:hypothetical protein